MDRKKTREHTEKKPAIQGRGWDAEKVSHDDYTYIMYCDCCSKSEWKKLMKKKNA